ncbi:MAG: polysaccharide deacetylase family protein [Clostridia bacterium]|nr:polysaccharide deacetylase family protein [Clostridia bacterium]
MKKLFSLILSILLIALCVAPAYAADGNPTEYSGAFNDTDWVYTNRLNADGGLVCGVDENGKLKTSDSAKYTVTSAADYDLGDSFRLDFDYRVVNNYNCNADQYLQVSVGDLQIRINNSLKPDEPADSDWIKNKRPYGTTVSLYWNGNLIKSGPTFHWAPKVTVGYGIRVEKGNVTVTRSVGQHEKAVLRVTSKELLAAGGSKYFDGVKLAVYSAERYKTIYLSNLAVTQNIGTDDFENFEDFMREVKHGDVDEDLVVSASDLSQMTLNVLGLSEFENLTKLIADTDRDGRVSSADLLQVKQNILGLSEPNQIKAVAITFDDGPSTDNTVAMLDMFKEYGGRATFFMIGNRIGEEDHDIMRRMVAEGHEVANHSYSHNTSFANLTVEEIVEDFNTTQQLIYDITGVTPTLFRGPGLSYDDNVVNNISADIINGTSAGLGTVESRIAVVKDNLAPGKLYLFHDFTNNVNTITAMEEVLPWLIEQGYAFVTASELIRLYDYTMTLDNSLGTW